MAPEAVAERAGVAGEALSPAAAEQLRQLELHARGYRRVRALTFLGVMLPSVLAGFVAFVASMAWLEGALGGDSAALVGLLGYLSVAFPLMLVGLAAAARRRTAHIDRAVRGLGKEAVPALMDILRAEMRPGRNRWRPVLGTVIRRLTDLLPRLRASDAALLGDRHRAALNEVLGRCARFYTWPGLRLLGHHRLRYHPPAFVAAILKGLEQVGDARAIPYVERLSRLPGKSEAERTIREAAERCLPTLREASERVELARTLLRPAHGAGEADPSTLLRPVDEESPD